MSKRAKLNTRSQRNASRSQVSYHDEENEEDEAAAVHTAEFVNRLVRYMLIKSSSNSIITEPDIRKNVLNKPGAPSLKKIIGSTRKVLNDVYGFKLRASFTSKTQYFYLQVETDDVHIEDDDEEFSEPEDTNRILLMLVLLHVFMTNNNCSEESLTQFMEKFPSEHFTTHTDFIKNACKQKYLESLVENNKVKYKWGSKAECTVSKMKMLDFMSNLYEKPKHKWTNALEAAQDQKKSLNNDDNCSDDSD